MKKILILVSIIMGICLLSISAYAREGWLSNYVADGSVVEATLNQFVNISALNKTQLTETATLDVNVSITDQDGKELSGVTPGQDIKLVISFNPLGSLEVPFEDLIGRPMFPISLLRGVVKHSEHSMYIIQEGDETKTELILECTVPEDATSGYFLNLGILKILGVTCANNIGYSLVHCD